MGKAETDILHAIQIEASKRGMRVLRNNVGAYEYAEGKWVHYGLGGKDWPDLIGFYSSNGIARFLAIEVKAPGEEPTNGQVQVLIALRRAGCIAFWCDSVEMFISELLEQIAQ